MERTRPAVLAEAEWADLRRLLAPVSDSYLRRLLRSSGLPLAPLVEGVRQDTLDELRRTLLALEQEYRRRAADRLQARACRRAVIEAKDHARWALRRGKLTPEQAAVKEEMILWMLTWLENPGAFPAWLSLRDKAR